MERRDYELIAQAIDKAHAETIEGELMDEGAGVGALYLATIELANALAADNPLFLRDKFFDACGFLVPEGQVL